MKSRIVRNYDVTATSTASPVVVWRRLLDARTWPVWSAVDSLDVDRWHGTCATRWGMGLLMNRTMGRVMQRMVDGLASHAAAID
jgi:hypothetical protein